MWHLLEIVPTALGCTNAPPIPGRARWQGACSLSSLPATGRAAQRCAAVSRTVTGRSSGTVRRSSGYQGITALALDVLGMSTATGGAWFYSLTWSWSSLRLNFSHPSRSGVCVSGSCVMPAAVSLAFQSSSVPPAAL